MTCLAASGARLANALQSVMHGDCQVYVNHDSGLHLQLCKVQPVFFRDGLRCRVPLQGAACPVLAMRLDLALGRSSGTSLKGGTHLGPGCGLRPDKLSAQPSHPSACPAPPVVARRRGARRAGWLVTLLPTLDRLGQARTSYQKWALENGASTVVVRASSVRDEPGRAVPGEATRSPHDQGAAQAHSCRHDAHRSESPPRAQTQSATAPR